MRISWLTRTLFSLLIMGIVALFGYQVYLKFSDPYVTQTVYSITVRDSYSTTALVLRDETLIPQLNEGTVRFLFDGVAKVTKDMEVAQIYDSYEQVLLEHRLSVLKDELAAIEEANDPGVTEVANLDTVNTIILAQLEKLGTVTGSNVVGSVLDIKNELTKQLSKKQIIIGQETSFQQRIVELQGEVAALEAQLENVQTQSVTSPASGYFVGVTDGYENALTTDYAENMTLEIFDMFLEGQNQNVASQTQTIGKVITNYNWRIAYPIPKDMEEEFVIGRSYDLNFLSIGVNNVEATVLSIISDPDEDRSLVILESNLMSDELATVRFPEIEVVFRSYQGLEVPTEAIRIPEGYQGVYIKEANVIRFRKIVPLYQTDDYVISQIDTTDPNRLQLFDTIFLSQKGVEEGKILE